MIKQVAGKLAPALLIAIVLLLGWLFIFVVPDHLVPRDLVPNGAERIKARHDDRATLLQSLIGILVLGGAYLTWQQVRISREGQVTERFTRAIDQLGSTELDVRIGGIYALARIAKDSPVDGPSIIAILSAFIQRNAPWPPRLPGQYLPNVQNDELPLLENRATDVHAALQALGGLSVWREGQRVFKSFREHIETRAWLRQCDLRKCRLPEPQFRGIDLSGSHLEESVIFFGDFTHGFLIGAQLQDSNLFRCTFVGATLVRANFERANLRGVQFKDADLKDARLQGATADWHTTWPRNFDPKAAGVQIEGERPHWIRRVWDGYP